MKKSRLLYLFSLLNFVAIFIFILFLPSNVIFKLNSDLTVLSYVGRWYNIILPSLQMIACFVILLIDMKERGKIAHRYRYLITYIAISIATYFSWIMLILQYKNIEIEGKVSLPVTTIILLFLSLVFFVFGYYEYNKEISQFSIFGFNSVKSNPLVWRKTHKFAGIMTSIIGIIFIVLAILNDLIFNSNWIYIIALTIWIVLYLLFTMIYTSIIAKRFK